MAALSALTREVWPATRGRVYRINRFTLLWNLIRDARLCFEFNLSLMAGYPK